MATTMSNYTSVRIPRELMKELREEAKAKKQSIASYVRQIISERFEQKEWETDEET